jgi:hypothetical protein
MRYICGFVPMTPEVDGDVDLRTKRAISADGRRQPTCAMGNPSRRRCRDRVNLQQSGYGMATIRCLLRRLVIGGLAVVSALVTLAPTAFAVPAPEVEYVYNVIVRRHFDFPNNDALGYGFAICEKITRRVSYSDVMSDVKRDVFPNDEQAANYVVSYAVGILCPAQIWQLRNLAAGYRPAP